MSLYQQLEALLSQYEPAIRDAFIEAVQDITDNAILKQVEEAVERNDVEAVIRAIGYSEAAFNPLVIAINNAFQAGVSVTMASIPRYIPDSTGVKIMPRFNMRDRRAEEWLRQESASLVTGIEEDVRTVVRNTLTAGMESGRNPRNVALDIVGRYNSVTKKREGGVIGLGEREEYWSRNVRIKLQTLDPDYFNNGLRDKRFDSIVRRSIETKIPLGNGEIEKLVDRYRANALRNRGETIGRTEALAALHQSEYQATRQALEQSALTEKALKRVWSTVRDGRERDAHREMHNQEVIGLREPFVSPTGARLMHPGDTTLGATGKDVIACRCRVRYVIDFYEGAT